MLLHGVCSLLAIILRIVYSQKYWVYLEMVHVALRPHHQLAGWNGLTAGAAGSAVPE